LPAAPRRAGCRFFDAGRRDLAAAFAAAFLAGDFDLEGDFDFAEDLDFTVDFDRLDFFAGDFFAVDFFAMDFALREVRGFAFRDEGR